MRIRGFCNAQVSYVLDTEDTYQKLKPISAPSPAVLAAKSAKFRNWQEAAQTITALEPPLLALANFG